MHLSVRRANKISKNEIRETTEKLAQANLDDMLKSNADNVALNMKACAISFMMPHSTGS